MLFFLKKKWIIFSSGYLLYIGKTKINYTIEPQCLKTCDPNFSLEQAISSTIFFHFCTDLQSVANP